MERMALRRLAISRGYICASCIANMKRGVISGPRRFHASGARRENVLDLLERRGLVNQIAGSRDALSHLLDSKRASIYAGIDPTAPSLHLGHLLPLMVLFWLRRHGQNVVTLIGGATAQVGDPSGRLTSRAKTAKDRQQSNVERMTSQIESMWHNNHEYSRRRSLIADSGKSSILNNDLWLKGLSILEFLRVLGSGTRVGTMLGRDT